MMNVENNDNMVVDSEEIRPLRFGKAGRLRHRSLVEGLFASGEGMYDYPLRMVWRRLTREEMESSFRNGLPHGIDRLQMMVTIPKKKRRHAVDRVLMRRRIREAYRLNRLPLLHAVRSLPDGDYVQLAFIYLHNDNMPYADVERKMKRLLSRLHKQIEPPCLIEQ